MEEITTYHAVMEEEMYVEYVFVVDSVSAYAPPCALSVIFLETIVAARETVIDADTKSPNVFVENGVIDVEIDT